MEAIVLTVDVDEKVEKLDIPVLIEKYGDAIWFFPLGKGKGDYRLGRRISTGKGARLPGNIPKFPGSIPELPGNIPRFPGNIPELSGIMTRGVRVGEFNRE